MTLLTRYIPRMAILLLILAGGCRRAPGPAAGSAPATGAPALSTRVGELELELTTLRARLDRLEHGSTSAAPEKAAAAGSSATSLPPGLAEDLAQRVNAVIADSLDARIDARIASRVGSADDIQAIFTQMVGEELAEKDARDRRQREEQRQLELTASDNRRIDRVATTAGWTPEQATKAKDAQAKLRRSLRDTIPALQSKRASVNDLLNEAASARAEMDKELAKVLTEDQIKALSEEPGGMSGWQSRQVTEIAKLVALDEEQTTLANAVFLQSRESMRNAFALSSAIGPGGPDMHEMSTTIRQQRNAALQEIMTPVQYQTYEQQWHGDRGPRGFGR